MAQGLILKKKATLKTSGAGSGSSNSNGITKRGSRQINPKKAKLIQQAKINKKFTSGLTAQTERMLGEKAGHLELLGGGKRGNKDKKSGDNNAVKHGKKNAAKKS